MTYAEFKAGTWPEKRYGPKQESLYLWLGMDKREITEDRTIWNHVANGTGHASIGLGCGMVLGCISAAWYFIIPLSITGGTIREIVQYAGNKQLHIVDRVWDISEGFIGGAIAWGVVAIVQHFKPEVFGWLF